MAKKTLWTLLALSLLAITAVSCSLLSEPAAPSGELQAEPVAVEEPVQESTAQEDAAEEEPVDTAAGRRIFQIDPAASQVRFELDEVLRGNLITVVGVTDQVVDQIALDGADLSSTQIGEITINARTLATDNNFRNRALNNEILDTGEYEFITFSPTVVNGLADNAAVGDMVEFSIDGDLTIRDVTQPVTFNVTASLVSEMQLAGSAAATIARDDFNLTIPSVPSVADVEEEVELYIDFIANAS